MSFDIVVPTIGRPSLGVLLEALAAQEEPITGRVVIVDDRRSPDGPLPGVDGPLRERIEVVRGRASGPAAARNAGWRAASASWIAFLDDDVVPPPSWSRGLRADLSSLDDGVAASQGRIRVPLPTSRRPTDWERNVAGLEVARWATADMAYRRSVLEEVGGFDERFPRAYREDADLALRVVRTGYRIALGEREITHPVRPADRWVSVRLQAGNEDDPLMRTLHGPAWRDAAAVPAGRRPWHLATVGLGVGAVAAALTGATPLAITGALGWFALTASFAYDRIAPGPRTPDEVATMVVTSTVLPWAATYHWARGVLRARRLASDPAPAPVGP
jgi:Glycosyl transferase family 2